MQIYCEKQLNGFNRISHRIKNSPTEINILDHQHLIIGGDGSVDRFLKRKSGPPNPSVVSAIEKIESGSTIVACVTKIESWLRLPAQIIPDEIKPFLGAESTTIIVNTSGGTTKVAVSSQYKDEISATNVEKSIKSLLLKSTSDLNKLKPEMEAVLFGSSEKKIETFRPIGDLSYAGSALLSLGISNQMEDWILNLPIVRNGSQLKLDYTIPKEYSAILGYYLVGLGLMESAVQKVQFAAGRMNGQNNLRWIGMAIHNYHETYGRFPSQSPSSNPNAPKDPKKRLSWRVHILPYLENDGLYRQFKLDEPWDSEHNKKLIPLMPNFYKDTSRELEEGKTLIKGITGKEAFFHPTSGRNIQQITDGTSNTIMIVAAGEPVIWTAPEDIEFDSTKNPPDLSKPFGARTNVVLADGSVRTIDFTSLKPDVIKSLLGVADGTIIPPGILEDAIQNMPKLETVIPQYRSSPPTRRSKGP